MADTEGRWVTMNGARVFINNKGDVIMGLGKRQVEETIKNSLVEYVAGGYASPKDALTDEEFEFIKENMVETNKPFYRVEKEEFTLSGKEVGDTFSFQDDLRSFSSDKGFIEATVSPNGDVFDEEDKLVVFKTVGKGTKHFDMSKYTEEYNKHRGSQSESLLGGKFKILSIQDKEMGGVDLKVVTIKQV